MEAVPLSSWGPAKTSMTPKEIIVQEDPPRSFSTAAVLVLTKRFRESSGSQSRKTQRIIGRGAGRSHGRREYSGAGKPHGNKIHSGAPTVLTLILSKENLLFVSRHRTGTPFSLKKKTDSRNITVGVFGTGQEGKRDRKGSGRRGVWSIGRGRQVSG